MLSHFPSVTQPVLGPDGESLSVRLHLCVLDLCPSSLPLSGPACPVPGNWELQDYIVIVVQDSSVFCIN